MLRTLLLIGAALALALQGARAQTPNTLLCESNDPPCLWTSPSSWSAGIVPGSSSNCSAETVVADKNVLLVYPAGLAATSVCLGSLTLGASLQGLQLLSPVSLTLTAFGVSGWNGATIELAAAQLTVTDSMAVSNSPMLNINGSAGAMVTVAAMSVASSSMQFTSSVTAGPGPLALAGGSLAIGQGSVFELVEGTSMTADASGTNVVHVEAGGSLVLSSSTSIAAPIVLDASSELNVATNKEGAGGTVTVLSIVGMGTIIGVETSNLVVQTNLQSIGNSLVFSTQGIITTPTFVVLPDTGAVINAQVAFNVTENPVLAVDIRGSLVLEGGAYFGCVAASGSCSASFGISTTTIDHSALLDFNGGFSVAMACANFGGYGSALFSGPVNVGPGDGCMHTVFAAQYLYINTMDVLPGAVFVVGNITGVFADHDDGEATLTVHDGAVVFVDGADVTTRVSFDNQGEITLGADSRLLVSSGTADEVAIHGKFNVPSTAVMSIDLLARIDAPLEVNGTLRLDGGSLTVHSNATISDSLLFSGNVVVDFSTQPVASLVTASAASFAADLTLTWAFNPVLFVPMRIDGPVALGGVIEACALSPTTAPIVLMEYARATGNFAIAQASAACNQPGRLGVTQTHVRFVPSGSGSHHKGLSGSAIAGIVLIVLVVVCIGAAAAGYLMYRRPRAPYRSINE